MKIVLADEQQAFRDSLRIALWHEAGISVVAEAGSAAELYPLMAAERPDLLVLDLMTADPDGISIAAELTRRGQSACIMILSGLSDGLLVGDAFDAGVRAYALKQQPLTEVIEAMRIAARGERYLAPALGSLPIAGRGHGSGDHRGVHAGIDLLSRREREIFSRIVHGASSRDIAEALSISLKTVETHRSHINRKLGVHSPAELVRLAAMKGLLASPPESGASVA